MMTIAVEVPVEVYEAAPVPAVCTVDGEMLARILDLPAGAWMASVLESVDVTRLSAWDLPGYLQVASRVQAWAASCVDSGIAELAARAEPNVAADAEASVALRESLGRAQTRVHRAQRLRTVLSPFKGAFADGQFTEEDVAELVKATDCCDDPEILAKVQEATLRHRAGKSARELGRYARRTLDRLDPAAASRRAKKARDHDDVILHPGADGKASVVTEQPVEDAMIVRAAADAKAISAKQAGDPRPIGVLRAAGLTQLCADYLTGVAGSSAPRSNGRPIEIGIVLGLRTALGLDDLPGEIPAAGIVPREVIGRMVATELPRLRLLVVDDNPDSPGYGRLVYRAHDGYRPTPDQVAHVRAAYPTSLGPASETRAERCDIDHFTEYPDGATIVTNLGPFDRPWHNRKTRGSLIVTVDHSGAITVTTVLGQTRTVSPYDYSPHLAATETPGDAPPAAEPPPF